MFRENSVVPCICHNDILLLLVNGNKDWQREHGFVPKRLDNSSGDQFFSNNFSE